MELLVANAEQEARVESERILHDAVAEGEAVIAKAKDEGRTLLEQVQEARRRVLADLASRRRALGIQIEQLRAARDEMAASVHGVRDRVDGILSQLDRTDEEARAAAVAVAEQFRLHGGPEEPHDQDSLEEVIGDTPTTGHAGGPRHRGGRRGRRRAGGRDRRGGGGGAPSVDELFARIRAGADDTEDGGAPGAEPATEAVPEAATQAMDASWWSRWRAPTTRHPRGRTTR